MSDTRRDDARNAKQREYRSARGRRRADLALLDELVKRGVLEFQSGDFKVKISPMALLPKQDEIQNDNTPYEALSEDDFLFSSSPLEKEGKGFINESRN